MAQTQHTGIESPAMRLSGWLLLFFTCSAIAQEHHHPATASRQSNPSSTANLSAATLGTVHFKTSCIPAVANDFNRAVALLHSFEYDEARDVFSAVAKKDPNCAMAHWGEAMSYFHGLWGEYDHAKGTAAVAAARTVVAKNNATSAREKAYIDAISAIYTDEAAERTGKLGSTGYSEPWSPAEQNYADKMAALHKAYPDDDEATIFYALALNVTNKRSDKSHTNLRQCVSLLNPVFERLPNHPGVAHYIIHCSDNPDMANGALAAARKYAKIAPASAHATHMPSHIFAQLGLWDEMIDSNRASMKAAQDDANASACQKTGHTLHAMYFLTIALVQTGQVSEAGAIADRALKFPSTVPGGDKCDNATSFPLAGFIMETGDFSRVKDLEQPTDSDPIYGTVLWSTIGVGAAQTGNTKLAEQAEQALAQLRDARAKFPGASSDNFPEANRLMVAAWLAHQAGQREKAQTLLRQAADLQEKIGATYATFKPIREYLADMLMIDGKKKEALAEYEAVLKALPHRFNSVYGAGTAAFDSGDVQTAKKYYNELTQFAHGDERPELATARKRMDAQVAAK